MAQEVGLPLADYYRASYLRPLLAAAVLAAVALTLESLTAAWPTNWPALGLAFFTGAVNETKSSRRTHSKILA